MPSKAEVMWVEGPRNRSTIRSRDKIKRALKQFILKNYTAEKLQELYDQLTSPKDKLSFYALVLPYGTKKESDVSETNSAEKIEELKQILLQAIKSNTHEIETIKY